MTIEVSARSWSVFVPALPWRVLSSNAGSRSRRDPWSRDKAIQRLKDETVAAIEEHREPQDIAEARMQLKAEVMDAIIGRRGLPHFDCAVVMVTLLCTSRRPKAEQCPRCRLLIAGGDYPSWAMPERGKALGCICYRPRDVFNIGGDTSKPIVDALCWTEILDDDDFAHVPEGRLRIERVDRLEQEGIVVSLQEVVRG